MEKEDEMPRVEEVNRFHYVHVKLECGVSKKIGPMHLEQANRVLAREQDVYCGRDGTIWMTHTDGSEL